QKKTEERLEELASAQKKTEERLEELASAQKKTEERLEELALAQKKTEERLEELALAQKKTEEEVRLLTKEVKKIKFDLENVKDHVGALANTVGYTLENEAYKYLPKLLKEFYNIQVLGDLKRDFIEIAPKKYVEINILGRAKKDGEDLFIVGESKVQLRISHIKEFKKKLEKIREVVKIKLLPIFVCHQAKPEVKQFCSEQGILLFLSYQFK
ncbi:MAG: chordopoxvirus fusion protein, partial [Caldimicrobium sp.]|nr:chordopoxvirus fusion protein [Caldimicrobium sp.]MDW8182456.1 chordopoxvirus fusion protein [Caldimicrobium sp.]